MTPVIQVSKLSYQYPDGTQALRDLSFSVAPGECVGLVGPNGSGKSTLLLHLNGILPEAPKGDQVRIQGTAVNTANLSVVRRELGLLFQDPDDQLFCANVGEDVAFGPEQLGLSAEEVSKRVGRALAQVGLPGHADRVPHRLSQGEKRRVCLAGLLAYGPSILVLDEPSSGLDPRGRRELMALLWDLPCTKFIASHDLEMLLELCPRTLLLSEGRLIADRPTIDLLSDSELMLKHGLETPHGLQHVHPHPGFVVNPRKQQTRSQ